MLNHVGWEFDNPGDIQKTLEDGAPYQVPSPPFPEFYRKPAEKAAKVIWDKQVANSKFGYYYSSGAIVANGTIVAQGGRFGGCGRTLGGRFRSGRRAVVAQGVLKAGDALGVAGGVRPAPFDRALLSRRRCGRRDQTRRLCCRQVAVRRRRRHGRRWRG